MRVFICVDNFYMENDSKIPIYFQDCINQNLCKKILFLIESSPFWQEAQIIKPNKNEKIIDHTIRKQSVIQYNNMTGELKSLVDICCERITTLSEELFNRKLQVGLIQAQRTREGEYFKFHKDSPIYQVSTVTYLTDAISHKLIGGETIFKINDNKLAIKPQQGKVCIFDSSLVHKGAQVDAGIKYSLVICFKTTAL